MTIFDVFIALILSRFRSFKALTITLFLEIFFLSLFTLFDNFRASQGLTTLKINNCQHVTFSPRHCINLSTFDFFTLSSFHSVTLSLCQLVTLSTGQRDNGICIDTSNVKNKLLF